MRYGFSEEQLLDMPVDKFRMYMEASREERLLNRREYVADTAAAVGGLFTKNGVKDYLEKSLNGED